MSRPNNEGGGVTSTRPPMNHLNEQPDFARADDASKELSTMQARAALCGCTLHELADGYLVCRWNYSKAVPCLRAVGDLLRQMGGR